MDKEYAIKVEEVLPKAAGRWDFILAQLAPSLDDALSRPGKHVPCPVHGGKDGFRVFKDYAETGRAVCNTCGQMPGGLKVLQWANQWTFYEALKSVHEVLGGAGGTIAPRLRKINPIVDKAKNNRRRAVLRRYWREALPYAHPKSEPLRRYFASRGLPFVAAMNELRMHPAMPYYELDQNNERKYRGKFPAMLALVVDAENKPLTLHRTYLTMEGKKAFGEDSKKLMSYPSDRKFEGASIRLMSHTHTLFVTEGIENALAVMAITKQPCWPLISDTIMMGFTPPPGLREFLVYGDKDANQAGLSAATRLIERVREMDEKVRPAATGFRLPPMNIPDGCKGVDWLDYLGELNRTSQEAVHH